MKRKWGRKWVRKWVFHVRRLGLKSHRAATDTVSNGRSLEIYAALGVDLVHQCRNVLTRVALTSDEKLLIFELREALEEGDKGGVVA